MFEQGDAWFRTGDLMRQDERRLLLFRRPHRRHLPLEGRERLDHRGGRGGWPCPGVKEANVYGVAVPGAEGRAGMAALVVDAGLRHRRLRRHLGRRLPAYAQPLFVRICSRVETTETFKPKKHDLVREGYRPGASTAPVYLNDRSSGAFVALDTALYELI